MSGERSTRKTDDVGISCGSEAFPPVDPKAVEKRIMLEMDYTEAQTLLFVLRRVTGHPDKSRLRHLINLRDALRGMLVGDERAYRDRLWHGGRIINLLDGSLSFRTEDARSEYAVELRKLTTPERLARDPHVRVVVEDLDGEAQAQDP